MSVACALMLICSNAHALKLAKETVSVLKWQLGAHHCANVKVVAATIWTDMI